MPSKYLDPITFFRTYGRNSSKGASKPGSKATRMLYRTALTVSTVLDGGIQGDSNALREMMDTVCEHLTGGKTSREFGECQQFCELLKIVLSGGKTIGKKYEGFIYGETIQTSPHIIHLRKYVPFYLLMDAMMEKRFGGREDGHPLFEPESVDPEPVSPRKMIVEWETLKRMHNNDKDKDIIHLYNEDELKEVLLRFYDGEKNKFLCHECSSTGHVYGVSTGSDKRHLAYFLDYVENSSSGVSDEAKHLDARVMGRLKTSLKLSDSIQFDENRNCYLAYVGGRVKKVEVHRVYVIGLHGCLKHEPSYLSKEREIASIADLDLGILQIYQFPVDRINDSQWEDFRIKMKPEGVVFGLMSDECEEFVSNIVHTSMIPCIRTGKGDGRLDFMDIPTLKSVVKEWYTRSIRRDKVAVR